MSFISMSEVMLGCCLITHPKRRCVPVGRWQFRRAPFAVKPRSFFLILVAGIRLLSSSHGQQATPNNEDLLRQLWQTSPDSQKISSDAAATQLLPGEYSETGLDLTSTLFIFPDHSYVETVTLLPVGLWAEGSWQFDRGVIELRSTW